MGTLFMSFLKGLFARDLIATSFLTSKNIAGKFVLLKNTKQVHRTCEGLKIRTKNFTLVFGGQSYEKFSLTKKNIIDFKYLVETKTET